MKQGPKPGHGDHWLAVLEPGDPRLLDVVAPPTDAPAGAALLRAPITEAIDLVQVTADRRLVTAYPEPRATALVPLRPRELALWETGAEAWLVAEHAGAGVLTLFLTDLVESATRYEKAPRDITLELGAIAYDAQRAKRDGGPARMEPATRRDARFLPDDYWLRGDVLGAQAAGPGEILDVQVQGGLRLPVVTRQPTGLSPGEALEAFVWLTARWPSG